VFPPLGHELRQPLVEEPGQGEQFLQRRPLCRRLVGQQLQALVEQRRLLLEDPGFEVAGFQ
jgi:hypothetical protein